MTFRTEAESPLLVDTDSGQELVDVNLMNAQREAAASGGGSMLALMFPTGLGYLLGGKYGALAGLGVGLLVSRR